MYTHEKRSGISLPELGVLIEYSSFIDPRNQKRQKTEILLKQVDVHVLVEADHGQVLFQTV